MKVKVSFLVKIVLLLAACSSNANPEPTDIPVQTFAEAIDAADEAELSFEISCEAVYITPLNESENLIEAQVGADRNVTWRVDSGARTEVILHHAGGGCNDNPRWDIALSQSLPLVIDFDAGQGSLDADLSGIDLRAFDLEVNSGFADLTLPANDALTDLRIDLNTGNVDITMAEDANVRLDRVEVNDGSLDIAISRDSEVRAELLYVNSGDIRIEVPEQALLKITSIEVNSGTLLLDSAVNLDIEASLNVNSGDFFLNIPDGTAFQLTMPSRAGARVEVPFEYTEREADDLRIIESPNFPSEFSVVLVMEGGSGRVFVNRDAE